MVKYDSLKMKSSNNEQSTVVVYMEIMEETINMTRDIEIRRATSTEEPQNILYSGVEKAIRTLKRNRSLGSDEIAAQMIPAGREQLVR